MPPPVYMEQVEMTPVSVETFMTAIKDDSKAALGMLPKGVTQKQKVQYGEVDGFKLMADLYYCDEKPDQKRPALIFSHGGGWYHRNKLSAERQAAYLALKHNVFVVTIFYRLGDEAPFPAALEDLKCSIRWVRSLADKYSIDTDKIALMGNSAGSHLSALAAATNGVAKYEGTGGYDEFSSDVNLAILDCAPFDLREKKSEALEDYLGGTLEEVPENYAEASPLCHAHKEMPPILMIHGDLDEICPHAGAVAMKAKLDELGVPCELMTVKGRPHVATPEMFFTYIENSRRFLAEHFNLA
ncbi:MAG: alpha/beta hydrolase [Planctomycetes bacterium]|nr:alpha/beta hydrolase [Planctomycetota bacterium]